MSAWKTVRVFLSSTFRDMHAERDHLLKVTFPRVREWCAERRLFFVDIEGHMDEDRVKKALEEVKSRCLFLKILGSYPAHS